jgi:hypothetical protein
MSVREPSLTVLSSEFITSTNPQEFCSLNVHANFFNFNFTLTTIIFTFSSFFTRNKSDL